MATPEPVDLIGTIEREGDFLLGFLRSPQDLNEDENRALKEAYAKFQQATEKLRKIIFHQYGL